MTGNVSLSVQHLFQLDEEEEEEQEDKFDIFVSVTNPEKIGEVYFYSVLNR